MNDKNEHFDNILFEEYYKSDSPGGFSILRHIIMIKYLKIMFLIGSESNVHLQFIKIGALDSNVTTTILQT